MAKATTKKPVRAQSSKTATKKSQPVKVNRKAPAASRVQVKKGSDVIVALNNFIAYNLHDRFNFNLSKTTQTRLVAFGPWLALLFAAVISPQLLNLAKNGNLMTVSGFFNDIFFNQQAWVMLIVILLSTLLIVDGVSDLFAKKLRGWNRVYIAALITTFYTVWQVFSNLPSPAAPILSFIGASMVLFCLLDVRKYYK